jgi:hypothetical protein
MNLRKALPFILLVILAIAAIAIRKCNEIPGSVKTRSGPAEGRSYKEQTKPRFDRNVSELFFTKHARCRMKCRNITQQEIKDILANGEINYNKSDLDDPNGVTYALEGMTRDRQKVRVIFAPKKEHMSVVTVIDLNEDHSCNCN